MTRDLSTNYVQIKRKRIDFRMNVHINPVPLSFVLNKKRNLNDSDMSMKNPCMIHEHVLTRRWPKWHFRWNIWRSRWWWPRLSFPWLLPAGSGQVSTKPLSVNFLTHTGLINIKFTNDEIVIDNALVVDRTSWPSTPHLQGGAISG